MPDWYDKLLTLLGLDSVRNDHLLGVPLREFPSLEFRDGPGSLSTTLCRLPDGQTQIVFQVAAPGNRWVGFLPCTSGNLDCLEQFLERTRSAETGPNRDEELPGLWTRLLHRVRPARQLVTMAPLPHRHPESVVEWALVLGPQGTQDLQFIVRGPRGLFRRRLNGSPEVTAWLNEIATVGRRNSCVWAASRPPGH